MSNNPNSNKFQASTEDAKKALEVYLNDPSNSDADKIGWIEIYIDMLGKAIERNGPVEDDKFVSNVYFLHAHLQRILERLLMQRSNTDKLFDVNLKLVALHRK